MPQSKTPDQVKHLVWFRKNPRWVVCVLFLGAASYALKLTADYFWAKLTSKQLELTAVQVRSDEYVVELDVMIRNPAEEPALIHEIRLEIEDTWKFLNLAMPYPTPPTATYDATVEFSSEPYDLGIPVAHTVPPYQTDNIRIRLIGAVPVHSLDILFARLSVVVLYNTSGSVQKELPILAMRSSSMKGPFPHPTLLGSLTLESNKLVLDEIATLNCAVTPEVAALLQAAKKDG